MSFQDCKILSADIAAYGVQSQPNKLTGTAQENKAVFDALIKNLVKVKLNALIDELTGAGAAAQIGIDTVTGMSSDNLQDMLEEIVQSMIDITQGSVSDGSITSAKLASGAVDTGNIADGAVTTAKLAATAVTTAKIALLAITTALIADAAVTADKIASGAVTEDKLGAQAVTSGKIASAAVDNTKLAEAAVTSVKIAAGAVIAAKIAAGAVTAEKLGSDILPVNVGIKSGTAVPTTSDIAPGQVYLRYSE